jgi:hypothetical protein
MKTAIFLAAAAALSTCTFAYAGDDDAKIGGLVGGAATGAVIGGPVGAVIGGAAGLTLGAAIDPPPDRVVTYVQEQPVEQNVIIKERIRVGSALPDRVVLIRVPDDDRYAYAVINKHRVIVNPKNRVVVRVMD